MRLSLVLGCVLTIGCSSGGGDLLDPGSDAGTDSAGDKGGVDPGADTGADPGLQDIAGDGLPGDADVEPAFPPHGLPFVFTRPDEGEPLTQEEVQAFTSRITGFWQRIGFFRWVLRTTHGVDASTGTPDWLTWWADVDAVKEGDKVTFRHNASYGGAHNNWIPSSRLLSEAMAGYRATGDWDMGKAAEQFCKGLTATMKGMVYDENDTEKYLMSRNFVASNHEFVMDWENWRDDGRKKAVEFDQWYFPYETWNAQRFEYEHNPYWGDVWVTNLRSKDDVCHIFRTAAFIPYLIEEAQDDWVKDACSETMDYLRGFARDIVDHGYNIRTKDKDGNAYIPPDQDLASFVWYTGVDPRNECAARVASDLVAYGEIRTEGCGDGFGTLYDEIAVITHYFNYDIIRNFHMAAAANALVYGHDEAALELLKGLAKRADSYMHPEPDEPGVSEGRWWRDVALFLLQSASVGLPLTSKEARLVQQFWDQAVQDLSDWPRWDLWDESVPDGTYSFRDGFRPAETDDRARNDVLVLFLEYCASPFRNPDGVQPVDCDVILDMEKWGD